MSKKRYVQVGVDGRSMMYTFAILKGHTETSELVGLCDANEGRLQLRAKLAAEEGAQVPTCAASDFDRMIAECKPDCVIVTTKDCTHDEYICRAMELGCDVITEKPMTTDAAKCQRIINTQKRTGKKCVVTFNYRYSPPRTQVKDLLMSGVIGDVLSVDFHWMLDTNHGADYFRRWHRNKQNSGGLMVHKATHHFDLVNWWLSSVPSSVFAMGHCKFYTPQTAMRYGLKNRSERCSDCPESARCPFFLDIRGNVHLDQLYAQTEQYDGYFRDRCVFSDQIDIEDSMNVVVGYESGAKMSYSLNAFQPWEGYTIDFNGSKGRLEHKCRETVYVSGDGTVPGELLAEATTITIFPHFGTAYSVPIWEGVGAHGGGDLVMLNDLFHPNPPADKYLRAADQRSGAYSILTGVAANLSMATGKQIYIADLAQGIGMPDYPPMPSPNEPIPLPATPARRLGARDLRAMREEVSKK